VTWHVDERGAHATAEEAATPAPAPRSRRLDLGDADAGPAVVADLADAVGGLDALVNNAGTGDTTPFLDLDLATWRHVLAVDLTGAFACAQAAARRMVAAGASST
jgi:NAD(P)-dependent dehydrogenase (short-subunit alcohol dehydrogenase family)